jgi:hypothetical protein
MSEHKPIQGDDANATAYLPGDLVAILGVPETWQESELTSLSDSESPPGDFRQLWSNDTFPWTGPQRPIGTGDTHNSGPDTIQPQNSWVSPECDVFGQGGSEGQPSLANTDISSLLIANPVIAIAKRLDAMRMTEPVEDSSGDAKAKRSVVLRGEVTFRSEEREALEAKRLADASYPATTCDIGDEAVSKDDQDEAAGMPEASSINTSPLRNQDEEFDIVSSSSALPVDGSGQTTTAKKRRRRHKVTSQAIATGSADKTAEVSAEATPSSRPIYTLLAKGSGSQMGSSVNALIREGHMKITALSTLKSYVENGYQWYAPINLRPTLSEMADLYDDAQEKRLGPDTSKWGASDRYQWQKCRRTLDKTTRDNFDAKAAGYRELLADGIKTYTVPLTMQGVVAAETMIRESTQAATEE